MSDFEDAISNVLMDFKNDRINYSEATLKIEECIVRQLQLNLYLFHRIAELGDFFTGKQEGGHDAEI